MTYKICEIVKEDSTAQFRNDVQLISVFDEELNHALVNSYLFTSNSPENTKSSIGALESITQAFISPKLENRFTFIATYGHGKSHTALALANFFMSPPDSEIFRTLMDKIENAVDNPPKSKVFLNFKDSKGEFLVIPLSGDNPNSIKRQFLFNLDRALDAHTATKGNRPPSWYNLALDWVSSKLDENQKEKGRQLFGSKRDRSANIIIQPKRERTGVVGDMHRTIKTHCWRTIRFRG